MATVSRGLPEQPHLDIPRRQAHQLLDQWRTPLFNAVLCGPRKDVEMTRALLARGASPDVRASLRKFLDWTDTPRWHEARDHHGARVGTHVSRSKLGQRRGGQLLDMAPGDVALSGRYF